MYYFGNPPRIFNKGYWTLEDERMMKSTIRFDDLPFNPDNLLNEKREFAQTIEKGESRFFYVEGWSILIIGDTYAPEEKGAYMVFFIKEKMTEMEMFFKLINIPVFNEIIDSMGFIVSGLATFFSENLQRIKVKTSKGICTGYIATENSLRILKSDSNYFCSEFLGRLNWHDSSISSDLEEDNRTRVIFNKDSFEIFSFILKTNPRAFYTKDGWLKVELHENIGAEPEWELIDHQSLLEKLISSDIPNMLSNFLRKAMPNLIEIREETTEQELEGETEPMPMPPEAETLANCNCTRCGNVI